MCTNLVSLRKTKVFILVICREEKVKMAPGCAGTGTAGHELGTA